MSNVDIIIRSIDQTKGGLAKVGKETNTFASSLKTAATNAAVVSAAIAIATQSYDKLITKTQQYNQQVFDMMLTTKGTAEETSKLIQVVDDTGVSYDTLKNAMKLAVKNGIAPNIESIAALSDEYNNLKDPVKQGQLLLDKFGKSGLEMQRVMVLGGDALRKMSAEMDGGLVLTQENIDASEAYRKNVDELSDSWRGFTVRIGNDVLPALNDMIDALQRQDGDIENGIITTGRFGTQAGNAAKSVEILANTITSSTQSYTAWAASLEIATEASATIQRENEDELSLIFQLSAAYKENAEAHAERTRKILLDMTLEKIAMLDGEKGFSDAEMNKALAVAETAGAVEAAAIRELVAMEGISTAIANGTIAAQDMKGILESLTTHGWTVQVAIQMQNLENLRDVLSSNAAANPGRTYNTPGRANGGPVSSNQMYMVGERGPELFVPSQSGNIIPNDKSGGMAGVIDAIERNRVSEERLVQLFENAVLRVMK